MGRPFLWAAHRCAALATYPEVGRTEPARARNRGFGLPPYLVLLRVGFALPATLLGRRCALTAPFHPYLAAVVITRADSEESQRRQGGMFSVALSVDRA